MVVLRVGKGGRRPGHEEGRVEEGTRLRVTGRQHCRSTAQLCFPLRLGGTGLHHTGDGGHWSLIAAGGAGGGTAGCALVVCSC